MGIELAPDYWGRFAMRSRYLKCSYNLASKDLDCRQSA